MKLLTRLKNLFLPFEKMSDGYHTFDELYNHRETLFIELCKAHKDLSWWSYRHGDGTKAFGYPWIIAGININPGCQITYHINTKKYNYFDQFRSEIKELKFAPTFDHHTSNDVLHRLKTGDYLR